MKKTSLGISAAALACFAYLIALFGGYTPLILVTGYVLIKEKNDWLRFSAVKAALLSLCFAVVSLVIYLLPNFISFINSICYVFEGSGIRSSAISNIANALDNGLELVEKVFFILLAIMSISYKTLKLGFIDKLAEKIAFGADRQANPQQPAVSVPPVSVDIQTVAPQQYAQPIPQPVQQPTQPQNPKQ